MTPEPSGQPDKPARGSDIDRAIRTCIAELEEEAVDLSHHIQFRLGLYFAVTKLAKLSCEQFQDPRITIE